MDVPLHAMIADTAATAAIPASFFIALTSTFPRFGFIGFLAGW
jgi:hypothetical protein